VTCYNKIKARKGGYDTMSVTPKQKNLLDIKQYITDEKGHKVAAILDIKELSRIERMLEDLSDLRAIEDRIVEPSEDYESYSKKRKSRLHV
jgi:hypothetical protein